MTLDARLDALRAGAHLLDGSTPTLVLHAPDAHAPDDRYARVELVTVERDVSGRLDLDAVLQLLAARGVNELQVEAGPRLSGALFERGFVDELLLYVAPTLLGDSAHPLLNLLPLQSMTNRRDWRTVDRRMIGTDQRLQLRPADMRDRA